MFYLDSQGIYRAGLLEEIPWVRHGFGTRFSDGWMEKTGSATSLATMRQVHSDRVLAVEGPGCVGEGDALISNAAGLLLGIRTADCLPILVADLKNRAVAAVHAGWRGTVDGILPKTIQVMADRFGSGAKDLIVAVGPGIGACCFEVGPEVAARFQGAFPERSDLDRRTKVDLTEANRRQLRQIGLCERQIVVAGACTCCGGTLFHSYRRDREAAGRMVSTIGVAAGM